MHAVHIGPRHQIVVPKGIFKSLHLEVGDLLEAKIEGGKIVLTPKRLAEKAPPPRLTPAEQRLLRKAQRKVEDIRKSLISSRGLNEEEIRVAVKAGLIHRDQAWWWSEQWQRGEREAERQTHRRQVAGPFHTVDDLMRDLHKLR